MRTTDRRRCKPAKPSVALLLLMIASCASPGAAPISAPLADQLVSFRSGASFAQTLYRSPAEASPVTEFEVDGERHAPVSDVFVVGVVERVEAGIGYSWPEGPQVEGQASTQQTHDFNDPRASISTIHLTVKVEDSVYHAPQFNGMTEVRIGLSLLSPARRIAAQLITNEKTAFNIEPDSFGVVDYGALLGFVDKDGLLVSFPTFDLGPYLEGPDVSSPTVPLADLLEPPKLVRLKTVDGILVGADG